MTFDLVTYTKGRVESQAKEFEVHLQGIANELLRQASMNDAITSNGVDVFHASIPSNQAIEAMVDLNLDDHACLLALEDHFISMGISVILLSVLLGPYDNQFRLTWSVESLEEAKKTKGGNIMTFDLLTYSEDRVSAEEAIPDELLGDALSIIIASTNTELGRDGTFYITVTEEEVVRALGEVNLLDAQERFYSYCDGLGIVVDISFRGFSGIPYVELTWTVQSLKEAKKLKEETL